MANRITQYVKDTRGELHHVAWPTREQTIIYTIIIAGISVFIALYLGLFDFIFTTSLAKGLNFLPRTSPISVTQQPVETAPVQQTEPKFDTSLGGTPAKN
ncbi:preprotein translocase subunit SecE [Candidatus Kaiserbacteria bacterium]|nr:preprotein translocase subunit SecE [Candidatus Kaiserbacteria bacterium]